MTKVNAHGFKPVTDTAKSLVAQVKQLGDMLGTLIK